MGTKGYVKEILRDALRSMVIKSFALYDPFIFGRSSDHKDSDPTVLVNSKCKWLFTDGWISCFPSEPASSPLADEITWGVHNWHCHSQGGNVRCQNASYQCLPEYKSPLTLLSDHHPSNYSLGTFLQHPGYPGEWMPFWKSFIFWRCEYLETSTVALSSNLECCHYSNLLLCQLLSNIILFLLTARHFLGCIEIRKQQHARLLWGSRMRLWIWQDNLWTHFRNKGFYWRAMSQPCILVDSALH